MDTRRLLREAMLAAVAAALLSGCAASRSYSRGDEPAIAAGASVIVEQPLRVSGGRARVFLQNGEIIRFQDRNRFEPWCSVGLDHQAPSGQAETIEPGRFEAGQPRRGARADAGGSDGVRLASAAGVTLASADRGGGLGTLTHYLEVPLASSQQPDVRELRCAVDRQPRWRGRITEAFIRSALGERARIEAPQG